MIHELVINHEFSVKNRVFEKARVFTLFHQIQLCAGEVPDKIPKFDFRRQSKFCSPHSLNSNQLQLSHTFVFQCNSHHDTVSKTNHAIIGNIPSGSISVYYIRCSEFADTANATPIAAAAMVPKQSICKSNSNCRFSKSICQQVPGWRPVVKKN